MAEISETKKENTTCNKKEQKQKQKHYMRNT